MPPILDAPEPVTVAAAARQAIDARIGKVGKKLTKAARRCGDDIEPVHRLRVASRRAAAALRLFGDVLPSKSADRLMRKLKQVRRGAGDARDLDVLIARLALLDPQPVHVIAELQADRAQAQRAITRCDCRLRGGAKLRKQCRGLWSKKRQGADDEALGPWGVGRVTELVDLLGAARPGSPQVEALHQFRIEAKRLRYAVELLTDTLPEGYAEFALAQLKALQGRLGAINDHAAAAERFEKWDRDRSRFEAATLAGWERQALESEAEAYWQWQVSEGDGLIGALREPLGRSLAVHM